MEIRVTHKLLLVLEVELSDLTQNEMLLIYT